MSEESKFKKVLKSRLLLNPPVLSDPRLLPTMTKGLILAGLGLCASTSGFSSTIYFPGIYICI